MEPHHLQGQDPFYRLRSNEEGQGQQAEISAGEAGPRRDPHACPRPYGDQAGCTTITRYTVIKSREFHRAGTPPRRRWLPGWSSRSGRAHRSRRAAFRERAAATREPNHTERPYNACPSSSAAPFAQLSRSLLPPARRVLDGLYPLRHPIESHPAWDLSQGRNRRQKSGGCYIRTDSALSPIHDPLMW